MEAGFMTIEDAILIREAREWIASLAFLESPRSEHLILRFTIIAGPGPNPVYVLLSHKGPETADSEEKLQALEEFSSLSEAVEAMKGIVRDLTPHGWRFVFNFYEC
jgi:hypothetical protein